MMNLAMSQIMTGSNFWDAPGHSMGGIQRSRDPHENLCLDQGSRQNVLSATYCG